MAAEAVKASLSCLKRSQTRSSYHTEGANQRCWAVMAYNIAGAHGGKNGGAKGTMRRVACGCQLESSFWQNEGMPMSRIWRAASSASEHRCDEEALLASTYLEAADGKGLQWCWHEPKAPTALARWGRRTESAKCQAASFPQRCRRPCKENGEKKEKPPNRSLSGRHSE